MPILSHLFTLEKKPPECTDYVNDNVFALDFDDRCVRVSRTLNLIAGDGQTNVLHMNTLDFDRWDERIKDEVWQDTYFEGWKKLKKLRTKNNSYRDFNFDICMANPPFAGDIKESRILAKYELSKKDNGKSQTKVSRDVLFIERNLSFLKPGGRMAIVLPQGRFNNSSDKYIREYISEHCRILAVVGLHGNVFKPHIYYSFIEGVTLEGIADALSLQGIRTPKGLYKWRSNTIRSILTNEKYCGDALMQKTYTKNFLTHKSVKNKNILPMYFTENHHSAIIDKGKWNQVQELLINRKNNLTVILPKSVPKHFMVTRIKSGGLKGYFLIDTTWTKQEREQFLKIIGSVNNLNDER